MANASIYQRSGAYERSLAKRGILGNAGSDLKMKSDVILEIIELSFHFDVSTRGLCWKGNN